MKQLIVLILIITTCFSCNTVENSCGQAYVGGEIINPNTDFLTLYRDSSPLDTIYLDENNRFSYYIESLNPGLHTIVHGDEGQFAIIEPGDSLMIRLNTFAFDESFVYSGKGSKKNNYLIDLFLSLEEENNHISSFSKLKPELFIEKLDSIKSENYIELSKFIDRYKPSELFKKVTKISIDYKYYTSKELYPYRYFGINKALNIDSLPKGYFDFRKDINYNDEELTEFYPYYKFLIPHFNNLASEKYFKTNNKTYLNRQDLQYRLGKLELMDSLIQSEIIKNILLKLVTRNFLSNSPSWKDSETLFNFYISKNTNEQNANNITNLFNRLNKLQAGNILPEVEVINYSNKVNSINKVTSKPTVIYFWSNINKYLFVTSHKKIKELRTHYPNIDFIAININSGNTTVWKRLLKQNNFDVAHEFRFKNPQAAKTILAIQYLNKIIVTDKNNTIVSSNANMFDRDFKKLLQKLE